MVLESPSLNPFSKALRYGKTLVERFATAVSIFQLQVFLDSLSETMQETQRLSGRSRRTTKALVQHIENTCNGMSLGLSCVVCTRVLT